MTDNEFYSEVVKVRGLARLKFMAKHRPLDLVVLLVSPFVMVICFWPLFVKLAEMMAH